MNWLSNFARPKLKALFRRRETPENLWLKCENCGDMIFHNDLVSAQHVCPSCDFHMKVEPKDRLASLFDGSTYELIELPDVLVDPLKFKDKRNTRIESKRRAARPDRMMP